MAVNLLQLPVLSARAEALLVTVTQTGKAGPVLVLQVITAQQGRPLPMTHNLKCLLIESCHYWMLGPNSLLLFRSVIHHPSTIPSGKDNCASLP